MDEPFSPLSSVGADAFERSITLDASKTESNLKGTSTRDRQKRVDVYFSADVETDGPIPGPYSLLSFALVYAGRFDGTTFQRPPSLDRAFYKELRPISQSFDAEALRVNGLDRDRLCREGEPPDVAMTAASQWVQSIAQGGYPVLVWTDPRAVVWLPRRTNSVNFSETCWTKRAKEPGCIDF